VFVLLCLWGITAEHILWFVGLSCTGIQLCLTDGGDTGGHEAGSGQSVVGILRSQITCQFSCWKQAATKLLGNAYSV